MWEKREISENKVDDRRICVKSDSISKDGKLCSWGENTLLPLMNQIGNNY